MSKGGSDHARNLHAVHWRTYRISGSSFSAIKETATTFRRALKDLADK